MPTKILAIESSCDETAAAIVADGLDVLSNVVASQIEIHQKYGGVVPELASREHLRQIVPVVREAVAQANTKLADLDAIAVTQGPGLVGALLVGITYAKTLAAALNKPLVSVNHLEGHVYAVFLEAHRAERKVHLPAICLIVSGGHTVLYEVALANAARERANNPATPEPYNSAGLLTYKKIGQTRDDAAGEAYDKVAKLLALGYPGGPILDRLAAASIAANGNEKGSGNSNAHAAPVKFGLTKTRGNPLDFSFSGLKTAVLYHLREHPEYSAAIQQREAALKSGQTKFDHLLPLCDAQTLALIREFQSNVVRTLVDRTLLATESANAKSILVSGGVAANSALRATFESRATAAGLEVFFPSRALSTDNAAMIAAAAHPHFKAAQFATTTLEPNPALALT
jgi:N6-L-threonylcarbamoyladenine synthase